MTDKLIQEVTSALVAILSVIGAFLIVFYELVHGAPAQVPDFVSLLIGAVVGSYLTRVASVNGARQAGTAAAQVSIDRAAATAQSVLDAASSKTNP